MILFTHTGKTVGGNTRDVKVERHGKVTIYKRGLSYYLYYRENQRSIRRLFGRDLDHARADARQIGARMQPQFSRGVTSIAS